MSEQDVSKNFVELRKNFDGDAVFRLKTINDGIDP